MNLLYIKLRSKNFSGAPTNLKHQLSTKVLSTLIGIKFLKIWTAPFTIIFGK